MDGAGIILESSLRSSCSELLGWGQELSVCGGSQELSAEGSCLPPLGSYFRRRLSSEWGSFSKDKDRFGGYRCRDKADGAEGSLYPRGPQMKQRAEDGQHGQLWLQG